jgi:hypothetical protein
VTESGFSRRPPLGTRFSAVSDRLSKVRSFWCAPWKRVRIFEEISGVFQDAHFSKSVRIFERCALLRQGTALDPVPWARKVAQARASASLASTAK